MQVGVTDWVFAVLVTGGSMLVGIVADVLVVVVSVLIERLHRELAEQGIETARGCASRRGRRRSRPARSYSCTTVY